MKKNASPNTSDKTSSHPIIGIGASAGGMKAFEALFHGLENTQHFGFSLIVVQHLSPDHTSILSELIQRYTWLTVQEVMDGMKVEPNHVYVIPPSFEMTYQNGALHLTTPTSPRGQWFPIDVLFQSLAQSLKERAVCILLSGTGYDGTHGLKTIYQEGGLTIVQTPESAEFDEMPNNAIATGLVDFQLHPKDIGSTLVSHFTTSFDQRHVTKREEQQLQHSLKQINQILLAEFGHDFSQYKHTSTSRRVFRRMPITQSATISQYIEYLESHNEEKQLLFDDLLIGVTNFFRDPDAFSDLTNVIPQLYTNKQPDEYIRVWSIGCSTGEEAYSLAILLAEYRDSSSNNNPIQIFATDIDSKSIGTARIGVFPKSISKHVSKTRLEEHFVLDKVSGNYHIKKTIRNMIIFSEHSFIKDPPFSNIDLITCRNVLIYLQHSIQKQLIPLFHYSLKQEGFLFLGSSESIRGFEDLFSDISRKSKIFQAKPSKKKLLSISSIPYSGVTTMHSKPPKINHLKLNITQQSTLQELTEKNIVNNLGLAACLTNSSGDILYFHGRTGEYLEPAPGEASNYNILQMAKEGLEIELMVLLHESIKTNSPVSSFGITLPTNHGTKTIDLHIQPVSIEEDLENYETSDEINPVLYLVLFETRKQSDESTKTETTSTSENKTITELKEELRIKDRYILENTIAKNIANEKLQFANQAMQSINEELQSTNEELETSREEMQSLNEELTTLNNELQSKLSDLSRVNNDLNNLMSATGIGTLFINYDLDIMRFTPSISSVFNLINQDIGRSIEHITNNFDGYTNLIEDVTSVLDSLTPIELNVSIKSGLDYIMRIQPYRTLENIIQGVVITFVNVTKTSTSTNI